MIRTMTICFALAWSMAAQVQKGGQAKAAGRPIAKPAQAISAEDAYQTLAGLQSQGKLVDNSHTNARTHLDLDAKDCFGFQLSNGSQIVGTSLARPFLWKTDDGANEQKFATFGVLYSSGGFVVGNLSLEKGSWLLNAGRSKLFFSHDIFPFVSHAPTVPLRIGIDSAFFEDESKNLRFSLVQEGSTILLKLGGNRLAVKIL